MNSKKNNKLTTAQETVKKALLSNEAAKVTFAPFALKPVTFRFARPTAASVKSVTRSTVVAILLALAATAAVKGDSLYPGSSTAVKTANPAPPINLFSDAKAHNVGDIL